jgi:hypothetical protein
MEGTGRAADPNNALYPIGRNFEPCRLDMRMEDILINTTGRFSIGIDHDSGKYYFSIPVSNRLADYEEYYELTEVEYQHLTSDPAAATQFAADCRAHQLDARLMFAPGTDRGT